MNIGLAQLIAIGLAFMGLVFLTFAYNDHGREACERLHSAATCFEAMNR